MKFWTEETINKIREGYYSAVYFNRTRQILLEDKNFKQVTMQIFQKKDDTTICGVDAISELFRETVGYYESGDWIDKHSDISLFSLGDGDSAQSLETVTHIKGTYAYFANLESVYLGILARLSKIATNTKNAVKAARGKPVLFFADRFDYFLNQELDGYAAKVGGVSGVATPAQAHFWDKEPSGTIPHALIAANDGSTVNAAKAFEKNFPNTPLIVLVDFENDCVKTSLEVAKYFKEKLWGIRLDTSEYMVDKSLSQNGNKLKGVNGELVKNVRNGLNAEGYEKVKIVVSGGFDSEKIEKFEKDKIPVDIYGVGSSLLRGNIDFTADIVEVEGKKIAKEGREMKPNKRLQVIDIK